MGRPFLWDASYDAPHATNPDGGTGMSLRPDGLPYAAAVPIRSCSRWGLPCRLCCQRRGALLPRRFALARGAFRPCTGGLISVALSLGSPPPAVSRHRIPVEPGLSSDLRPAVVRLSGGGRYAGQKGLGQGFVSGAGVSSGSIRASHTGPTDQASVSGRLPCDGLLSRVMIPPPSTRSPS